MRISQRSCISLQSVRNFYTVMSSHCCAKSVITLKEFNLVPFYNKLKKNEITYFNSSRFLIFLVLNNVGQVDRQTDMQKCRQTDRLPSRLVERRTIFCHSQDVPSSRSLTIMEQYFINLHFTNRLSNSSFYPNKFPAVQQQHPLSRGKSFLSFLN